MVLILLMAGLLLPQQPAATATGSIQGLIVEAGTSAPIADTGVFLIGPGVQRPSATAADANGRFTFASLPPGEYHVIVNRAGFAFEIPAAPAVNVVAGRTASVTIELPRAAAISGEVRDDRGTPRRGVQISVMRKITGGTAPPPELPVRTDEDGHFQVNGLVPGEYLVLASPPAATAREAALMPTFYPSVTDRTTALGVNVTAGNVTSGISITMITAPLYTVTGRIVDQQGHVVPGGLVAFVYDSVRTQAEGGQYSTRAQIRVIPAKEDGTFRITGLGPGTYRLTPWPAPPAGTPAQQAVDATTVVNAERATNVDVRDRDVSDVAVVLRTAR